MADLQTITIATGSGDTIETGCTKLRDDLIKAANTFADTADPSSPAEGRIWWRSDEDKLYIWQSAAKHELLGLHALNQDLDFQGNEAVDCHAEQLATGSLPTPGAGEEARVWYDTTLNLFGFSTAADNFYCGGMNVDASEHVPIRCSLNVAVVTTNPATASTATRRGGWLLDATTEDLNWAAEYPVPTGWTTANDLLLEVSFLLGAAETSGDDVVADMDWITLAPAGGDGTGKTVTSASQVTYDIGATATAQYDAHKLRFTIDHDDATNTVAVGDYLSGTIRLGSVAGVASIIVTSVVLLVPSWRVAWA